MKYIRTCDNIYPVYKETDDWYYVDKDLSIIIHKDEVKFENNSIDLLCDNFVMINNKFNCCRIWEYTYDELLTLYPNIKGLFSIYGAIWCEWGLKYVAKLNDNGRLELYDKN